MVAVATEIHYLENQPFDNKPFLNFLGLLIHNLSVVPFSSIDPAMGLLGLVLKDPGSPP